MHSVATGSFQRLSSLEALWNAWLKCRQGKRRQPRIAAFERNADQHLIRLEYALERGYYRPQSYRLKIVQDPKTRLIAAPPIRDRVLQQSLIGEIGPYYERSFIDHSYACLHGRGPHRAALKYLQWMRKYRYRLALDIRRYFASIQHAALYELFARRLRDPLTLALINQLLEAGGEVYQSQLAIDALDLQKHPVPPGCGLPLGGYLSHWSGDLYLNGLDHFVKRKLKIKAFQRYMDDFGLFDNDRERLEDAREAIREWLQRERGLALNPKRQLVLPTTQPCTYLGFRISRSGLAPGPKAKRRLKQRLRDVDSIGTHRLVRSLRSYQGVWSTIG